MSIIEIAEELYQYSNSVQFESDLKNEDSRALIRILAELILNQTRTWSSQQDAGFSAFDKHLILERLERARNWVEHAKEL
jgi:uncharacterized protein (DUF2267 family)